jgi:two-component system, chemotaxis family, protein-glutamate methylesterase/glutaminase
MTRTPKLRLVLVDDSLVCRELLRELLEAEGDVAVVATEEDGLAGLDAVGRLRPDLVLLDLRMPGMDGLTLVERIMAEAPTPILVITADPAGASREGVFEAVRRGALDVARKPDARDEAAAAALRRRVRELASIPVVRHMTRRRESAAPPAISTPPPAPGKKRVTVIGMAASAGGPSALVAVLKALPKGFVAPIAIVQHLPPGFVGSFASFLEARTALRPRMVRGPTRALAGEVLLVEADAHLILRADGCFDAVEGDPVDGHRPSASVLFQSLADTLGPRAMGIILSGMGRDGVSGLAALRARGARTIAQDGASSAVWGMPKVAHEEGAASEVLSPDAIGRALLTAAGYVGHDPGEKVLT